MSRTTPHYTFVSAGNTDDDILQYDVDMSILTSLYQFYRKDPHIFRARQRKLYEAFRAKMSVGYWDPEKDVELTRVDRLNSARYKKLLRNFLTTAYDQLQLFGFVGYYCVKDIAAWLEQLSDEDFTLDDQNDTLSDPLPFGIIPLGPTDSDVCGTYRVLRYPGEMRERLVFDCADDLLSKQYDFFVFRWDAEFEPVQDCVSTQPTLIVMSPFIELYCRRQELEESRTCGMDASFMGSHPESFIIVKPPPETSVEKISDSIRYTQNTLADASFRNSARRIELNAALVNEQLDQLQSRQGRQASPLGTLKGSGIDTRGPSSLYTARKRRYVRPDVKETLEVLPESMELARGPAPVILLDIERLVQQYEIDVCSAMDFPVAFMGTQRQGGQMGGARHNEADLALSQKHMDEQTVMMHEQFHNLFVEVYERTVGKLAQILPTEKRQRGQIRLHFDHNASKPDKLVMSLLPLVNAGILHDDEFRALILRNLNMKDEETSTQRNERKKRIAASQDVKKEQTTKGKTTKKKTNNNTNSVSAASSSSSASQEPNESTDVTTTAAEPKTKTKKTKKRKKSDKKRGDMSSSSSSNSSEGKPVKKKKAAK
jgi:hypothetical protein